MLTLFTPGTVGGSAPALDPEHPDDLLIAFPPQHYMEFSKNSGKYTPRVYVTESR